MELEIKICDMCHMECSADRLTEVDGQELCPSSLTTAGLFLYSLQSGKF